MAKNKIQGAPAGRKIEPQRLGIMGASGTGKTTKARELTAGLKRAVFIDPLGDYRNDVHTTFTDVKKLERYLYQNFTAGFRVAYVPEFGNGINELENVCELILRLQYGYGKIHHAKIALIVDELDESFPSGIMQRNPKNMFGYLCKRGRHFGISLVGISQRTAQVDVCFRGNCSSMYFFRHTDPIDHKKVIESVGNEYSAAFRDLRDFEYLLKNNGLVKIFKKNKKN